MFYLLATHGICVVPLSGFNSARCGFRFTLLEQDEERFETFIGLMKEALSLWTQTPAAV